MSHVLFENYLQDSLEYVTDWDPKVKEAYSMRALQQWDENDMEALRDEGRPYLTFDRTGPIIQSLVGAQITNRYQVRYLPREASLDAIDNDEAKGASEWARWVQQIGDFEQMESLAFQDCLICGVGCLEMKIAYDEDPDGRIKMYRVPIWEILWDPASVQPNMMDARYVIRDKWVDEDELASLFGKKAVDEVITAAAGQGQQDREMGRSSQNVVKTTEQRYAYDLTRPRSQDDRSYDNRQKRVRLYEMQRWERRYQTRVIAVDVIDNPDKVMEAIQNGQRPPKIDLFDEPAKAEEQAMEYQGAIDALNAELGEDLIPQPDIIEEFPVQYFYRSWHTKNEELRERELPVGGFTYNFLTAYEDWMTLEGARHFMGMMASMIDPQKAANKFMSQAVHLFNTNPKGALLYEEDFFINESEALTDWNKASAAMKVERGALSKEKDKFRQLNAGVSLRGIETLLQNALSAVNESVGVSPYTTGFVQDLRRTSGEAVNAVQEANLQTQANPFDSLRLYRKRMGRLILGFTEEYIDPELIEKVVGSNEAMAAFVQAAKEGRLQDEYNATVEEVPTSPNEKREVFKVFMDSQILPQLASQGVPLPPEIADILPVDKEIGQQFKLALTKMYEFAILKLEHDKAQLAFEMQQMLQQQAMGGQPAPPEGQGNGQPQPQQAPEGVQ